MEQSIEEEVEEREERSIEEEVEEREERSIEEEVEEREERSIEEDYKKYAYNFLKDNSCYKVNKFLIGRLGFPKALLLSHFFDVEKVLEKENKLLEDRFFLNLEKDRRKITGLNEHSQRKALKELQEEGIINILKQKFFCRTCFQIDHVLFYEKFPKNRSGALKRKPKIENQNLPRFNRAFIKKDSPLRISKDLIKVLGLYKGALLSYLIDLNKYYEKIGQLQKDGSFFRREPDRNKDTGISEYTQRKALKGLQEGELIIIKQGISNLPFFWINYKKFYEIFYTQSQFDFFPEEGYVFYNPKILEKGPIRIPPKKPIKGWVYFLQTGVYTKIGRTSKLKSRMKTFNTLFNKKGDIPPIKSTLIYTIETEDTRKLEKLLHEHYQHFRIKGEWFNLGHEAIEEIKQNNFPENIMELI